MRNSTRQTNRHNRFIIVSFVLLLLTGAQPVTAGGQVDLPAIPVTINGTVRLNDSDPRGGGQGHEGATITLVRNGVVVGNTITDNAGAYSFSTQGGGLTGCTKFGDIVVIATCSPVTTTFTIRAQQSIGAGAGIGEFTFSPAFRTASVSGRPSTSVTISRDFTASRPAIVFLSGYLLSLPRSDCPQTFVDRQGVTQTYLPGDCPNSAFLSTEGGSDAFSVPRALTNAGYHVQRAMLNINMFGAPSIRNQVPVLTTAIDRARAATGARRVIVIAHSTGTIVARRYIESDEFRSDVSHFFSFGGPHRGWHFEALAGAFTASAAIGGFVLTRSMIGAGGAVAATAGFCIIHTAACDMSRSSMAAFNNDFTARRGVTYHFIHGDALRMVPCSIFGIPARCDDPNNSEMSPAFRVVDGMNALAGTPASDGFIPADGINALAGTHDRLLTYDTHMLQVGPRYYFRRSRTESGGWTDCILPVLIDGTRSVCGTVRNPNVTLPTALSASANQTQTQQNVQPRLGTLSAGQTVTQLVTLVDGPVNALFAAQWQGGGASLQIGTPEGVLIDAAYASANPLTITHGISTSFESFDLSQAITGTYAVTLTASGAPITYTLVGAFDSGLQLSATRNRNWYPPGGTAVFSASLTGLPVSGESVQAIVRREDGITETVALAAQGGGLYSATYLVPNVSGYAEVTVLATGATNGLHFERARTFNFQIYPPSFKIAASPGYTETATRDALTITVNIQASLGGRVRVSGSLVDPASGTRIAGAVTSVDLVTGTLTSVPLRFDGEDINASDIDGPYRLARVLVSDERESTLVSDDQFNVFTTTARLANDFGAITVYMPLVMMD